MEVISFYRLYGAISALVLMALGAAWFAVQSAGESFVLAVATFWIAAGQLVVVARRRRRNLFTLSSLAFWILTAALMQYAGAAARDVAVAQMSAMVRMKNCSTVDCLGPARRRVKIAAGEAWIVNRYGANVSVKLYVDHQTECRLQSDYLFGGSKTEQWTCASAPVANTSSLRSAVNATSSR